MKYITNKILYRLYVLSAISPILILYILKKDIADNLFNSCRNLILVFFIIICCFAISIAYIRKMKKENTYDKFTCSSIEIAEPKYIPIYIAYFVIAFSIPNNWCILSFTMLMMYLLILKGRFSYFNPYLLFFGYNFYEVEIVDNQKEDYATYKIFLISKTILKEPKQHKDLICLNDFTYLDKGDR